MLKTLLVIWCIYIITVYGWLVYKS